MTESINPLVAFGHRKEGRGKKILLTQVAANFLLQLIQSQNHKDRFMNLCPHFDACSGCSQDLVPEVYQQQSLMLKSVQIFFESKNIKNFTLHYGALTHWRKRAKLAVRGRSGNILIGMFKGHSHEVLAIPQCQVHDPLINKLTQ